MADTERIDAYVFIRSFEGRPSEVLARLIDEPGVRFAARFTGAFTGFAAVEAASLRVLQERIDGRYRDAGIRSDWSVVSKAGMLIPKRRSPTLCALVRVSVSGGTDPDALLDDLERAFGPGAEETGYAAAVVTGQGYDLLVEFGAEDLTTLWGHVRALRNVEGVGRTSTAVADLQDNALRSEP